MQMQCDDVAGGAQCAPSCQSATRHVAYHLALSCRVVASASPAHEQSAARRSTVAWYYSGVPTRLVGQDYGAHPCVSQVP
jgi:hypothetical protein